jgi:hypothetical protein
MHPVRVNPSIVTTGAEALWAIKSAKACLACSSDGLLLQAVRQSAAAAARIHAFMSFPYW